MIQANAAFRTVRIAPVRQAGHDCSKRSKQTGTYSDKSSIGCPNVVFRRDQPDDIKDSCEHPGRYRHIGNNWMQGMTKPRSIEKTFQASWRLALGANDDLDEMLQRIAQSFCKRL